MEYASALSRQVPPMKSKSSKPRNRRIAPELTVIMAAKGRARYVGEAIESIRQQSFRNWQLLVIYGPSDDGALEVLRTHARADTRIRLEAERRPGLVHALNQAIAQTATDFMTFQESDDVSHPERLAACLAALRAHPEAAFAVPHLCLFDSESNLPVGTPPGDGFFMNCFRTQTLKRLEKIRPFFVSMPEWDLSARLEEKGTNFTTIPQVLYFKRLHRDAREHMGHRGNRSLEWLALCFSRWCRARKPTDELASDFTRRDLLRALRGLPKSAQRQLRRAMFRHDKKCLCIAREQNLFAALAPRIYADMRAALEDLGWSKRRSARAVWQLRLAAFASWQVRRARMMLRRRKRPSLVLPQQPIAAYMTQAPWQVAPSK